MSASDPDRKDSLPPPPSELEPMSLKIPQGKLTKAAAEKLVEATAWRSKAGMIVGGIAILGGIILLLLGLAGAVTFKIQALEGVSAELSNAAPGVVLALFGLLIIWITPPKAEVTS